MRLPCSPASPRRNRGPTAKRGSSASRPEKAPGCCSTPGVASRRPGSPSTTSASDGPPSTRSSCHSPAPHPRTTPERRKRRQPGRSLTDLIRSLISLAVMVGLGVAVGFRFHSDAGRILLGMLLILAFGYALSWMNTAIGISAKDPESAQNASTGPTFLLLFASNAIVPTSTLPDWLRPFARDQPLGVTASAVRELFEGGAAAHDAWVSLAWSAGITVVFFLTSYALYQRAAAK
ncbi:MAG TPA: ABC transporter permease [Trebonia sp.]